MRKYATIIQNFLNGTLRILEIRIIIKSITVRFPIMSYTTNQSGPFCGTGKKVEGCTQEKNVKPTKKLFQSATHWLRDQRKDTKSAR
jgi:hypothetical protein